MKRLGKLLVGIVVFLLLFLIFLPKKALWYEAEHLLKPQEVVLSGEQVRDTGLGLTLEGGTLYYGDLGIARLERITVTPWLFYNRIEVSAFRLTPGMKSFLPVAIDGATLSYSVLDPMHIVLNASGEFGTLSGTVGLGDRKIDMLLTPSQKLRGLHPFWLKEFKSEKGGLYRYESTY